MKASHAAAIFVLSLTAAMTAAAPPVKSRTVILEGPRVTVPDAVTVKKQRGPDFYLFYFVSGPPNEKERQRQVLFAYVGWYPSFPSEDAPKKVKESSEHVGRAPSRSLRWQDSKGQHNRDILVRLPPAHSTTPQYVHFAYRGLSDTDRKTADAIVASTLPPKPQKPEQPHGTSKSDKTP
jgi:hypothetical protein